MSEARVFKVSTPLQRKLARAGGRTVAEAERLAEAGLEAQRQSVIDDLGRVIGELEAATAARGAESATDIYRAAATVVDLAGFFDTGPLYEAAYSLCELSDRMQGAGAWSWPSVEVHVQALRLIHAGGCKADADAEALLSGLRDILAAASPAP